MKKVLLVLLIALYSFFFLSKSPVFAQSPTTSNTPQAKNSVEYLAPNTNTDVPNNLHTFTQSALIEVMSAAMCQLAGVDVINPDKGCLGIDSKSGKIGYVKSGGGLIGFATVAIGTTYSPPLHASDYARYLGQNFGIAKSTYAADGGFGFNALNPLIPIWSLFRNLAYVVLIVVFLIIGIAIMLRVRIDPRTVMTIQNQIPKVVIALIIITFSLAIAGLLIDLMYVVIFLIYSTFSGLLGGQLSPGFIQGRTVFDAAAGAPTFYNAPTNLFNPFDIPHNVSLGVKDVIKEILNVDQRGPEAFFGQNFFSSIFDTLGALFGHIGSWENFSVVEHIANLVSAVSAVQISNNMRCFTEGTYGISVFTVSLGSGACAVEQALKIGGLFTGIRFFITDIVPYLLIWLIVIIAILYALFKTFFMLITSYVLIILDVIFAPIWILAGILPGNSSMGFGSWVKDLVANLAVFPVIYLMLILAYVIPKQFIGVSGGEIGFTPPLLGNPLAGGFISSLIGLGLLLMMPQAAAMIKTAIKAPNLPTQAAGGPIKASQAVAGAMGGFIAGRMYRRDPRNGALLGPLGSFIQTRATHPIARFIFGIPGPRRPRGGGGGGTPPPAAGGGGGTAGGGGAAPGSGSTTAGGSGTASTGGSGSTTS